MAFILHSAAVILTSHGLKPTFPAVCGHFTYHDTTHTEGSRWQAKYSSIQGHNCNVIDTLCQVGVKASNLTFQWCTVWVSYSETSMLDVGRGDIFVTMDVACMSLYDDREAQLIQALRAWGRQPQISFSFELPMLHIFFDSDSMTPVGFRVPKWKLTPFWTGVSKLTDRLKISNN